MFRRILIANRGEIAVRVIRTARALGVETVTVHSDADAHALHVQMADVAVGIGAAPPADSYLRGDRIIEAALEMGAEAIHPGYGFLSENPDFVEAAEAAGLVFIGPSAQAIRAMGLKDAAKRLMADAGVPVVPGYHGDDQDPGHLEVEAHRIGYPVLIKAVAGGGGKGMRRVDRPEAFFDALESAKSEALGAFGNDAVLIEKFIERPRHIEVQVFGDGDRAVHLFERDCSMQRRHQKVLEEAPAPGMTAEVRAAMGAAAVRAAEAIGYKGAGTVEFIVDGAGRLRVDGFWFMEMNTRLQVEHPVTEAITGIDLVEWQLRVVAGEPLPKAQEQIGIEGHAVEARLYAEDVAKGFLPATGTLTHLEFASGARTDTGVRTGDTISPWYDPMIAKIITHGPTRDAAFGRMRQALAGTEVAGSVTNHAFLRRLAADPDVLAGDVDTGLIERAGARLTDDPVPCTRTRALAGLGALGLDEPGDPLRGATLWAPLAQSVHLDWAGEAIDVTVQTTGPDRFEVEVGGTAHSVRREGDTWSVDGERVAARVSALPGAVSVFWGNGYHFTVPDPLSRAASADAGDGRIDAPMPGLVKSVHVASGAEVAEGDRLVVMEAMKMEHVLRAARRGRVASVAVAEGDQVDAGAVLILLEEPE